MGKFRSFDMSQLHVYSCVLIVSMRSSPWVSLSSRIVYYSGQPSWFWGKGDTGTGSAQGQAGQGEESGHRAESSAQEPEPAGSTAAALNDQGRTWMKNMHLPSLSFLPRNRGRRPWARVGGGGGVMDGPIRGYGLSGNEKILCVVPCFC